MTTLQQALGEKLQIILYTEKQVEELLPRLATAAHNPDLQQALEAHQDVVHQQILRLLEMLNSFHKEAVAESCVCIDKLVDKSILLLDDEADAQVKDSLLIAAVQNILYQEMASYGAARMWALLLGHDIAADLLEQTLTEEEVLDEQLYDLAHSEILLETVFA